MSYINASAIKKLVREGGKRPGKDFLQAVNDMVGSKLEKALQIHNGSKKTLDLEVATLAGITK